LPQMGSKLILYPLIIINSLARGPPAQLVSNTNCV
jgi:hypothetical protein